MTKEEIIKEKQIMIEQLKRYSLQLRPFFELDFKLKDYDSFLYAFEVKDVHLERQKLIKEKIENKLKKLFGNKYKEYLKINLDGKLIFNIADHHQVLNHPFLVSANVIGNARKMLKNEKQEAIIVISSGDVPPNNYFSKNGFLFHDKRVPIFSNSERELTSYYIPKRDFNFIDKLKTADRWKEFNNQEQKFLTREYEKIKSFDYSNCQDYNDQISVIIKNTWPFLFEESLRTNLPELIYLTQEEIVTDCLIELLQEDNIISKCLFDENFRNIVLDNFRGNVVTWNEKEDKGTHFFWRKHPQENRSLRMYLQDGVLVPADDRFKDYSFILKKDEVLDLLKKKEIYPSLFMIFGVLNFYAGVKPLVGYGSLSYLDLMKKAWIKTLNDYGLKEEAVLLSSVETNGFVAGLAIFFERLDSELKTLYAYDIFYNGGMSRDYLEKILNMKFGELLSIAVPDIYLYYSQKYIPKEEWIKPKINFNDLAKLSFNWL